MGHCLLRHQRRRQAHSAASLGCPLLRPGLPPRTAPRAEPAQPARPRHSPRNAALPGELLPGRSRQLLVQGRHLGASADSLGTLAAAHLPGCRLRATCGAAARAPAASLHACGTRCHLRSLAVTAAAPDKAAQPGTVQHGGCRASRLFVPAGHPKPRAAPLQAKSVEACGEAAPDGPLHEPAWCWRLLLYRSDGEPFQAGVLAMPLRDRRGRSSRCWMCVCDLTAASCPRVGDITLGRVLGAGAFGTVHIGAVPRPAAPPVCCSRSGPGGEPHRSVAASAGTRSGASEGLAQRPAGGTAAD